LKIHRAFADSKRYPRETELKIQTQNTHKNNKRKQKKGRLKKQETNKKRQKSNWHGLIGVGEGEEVGEKRRKKFPEQNCTLGLSRVSEFVFLNRIGIFEPCAHCLP
jgi:hypothetical protein